MSTWFRNKIVVIVSLFFVIVLLLFFLQRYRANTGAYVNGERITLSAINHQVARQKQHDPNRFIGDQGAKEEEKLKKNLLEERITRTLLGQSAVKSGIEVTEAELEEAINALRRSFKSNADFQTFLQNNGLTLGDQREIMRDQLAAVKMRIKLSRAAKVSEEEIAAYLRANEADLSGSRPQVRLKVITVESEEVAKRVTDALAKGADFTVTAKKFSVTKDEIDIGWYVTALLEDELRGQLGGLQPGGQTPFLPNPDNTISTYQLVDNKVQNVGDKSAREQAQRFLLRRNQELAYERWLNEITDKADIQILL